MLGKAYAITHKCNILVNILIHIHACPHIRVVVVVVALVALVVLLVDPNDVGIENVFGGDIGTLPS